MSLSSFLRLVVRTVQPIFQKVEVPVMAEWLRPSAWIDQSGTPQPSLDLDANRLVLLDRLTDGQFENGDNGHDENDIPF